MYNARSWIGEALDSVFRQTYPAKNVELLLVDDGSSDDSALVAREFLRDRSMRGEIISCERNAGVSAARNTGWKLATGEWIQFLDADDLLARIELRRHSPLAAGGHGVHSRWQRLDATPVAADRTPMAWSTTTRSAHLADVDFGCVGPT
jgi:glycosyltransferase involved in cell wall biosynthesis